MTSNRLQEMSRQKYSFISLVCCFVFLIHCFGKTSLIDIELISALIHGGIEYLKGSECMVSLMSFWLR